MVAVGAVITDDNDRVTYVETADGVKTGTIYGPLGRTEYDLAHDVTGWITKASYLYDLMGHLTKQTDANGISSLQRLKSPEKYNPHISYLFQVHFYCYVTIFLISQLQIQNHCFSKAQASYILPQVIHPNYFLFRQIVLLFSGMPFSNNVYSLYPQKHKARN